MGMYEVKKDCFAYKDFNGKEECNALKRLYCRTEECKFYKRRASLRSGADKTKNNRG